MRTSKSIFVGCGVFLTTVAAADIDRLQLINGAGPSVSPGIELGNAIQSGNTLVFSGTNLTTNAVHELHGADSIGAFVIGSNNSGTLTPLTGVTNITEFNGNLIVYNGGGMHSYSAGNDDATFLNNLISNTSETLVHNNILYARGLSNGGTGTDLFSFDSGFNSTPVTNDGSAVSQCADGPNMATLGTRTVLYIGKSATGVSGDTIWKTLDGGTPELIEPTSPTFTAPCYLYEFNGRVYYEGFESGTGSSQLWSTDGTAQGTSRLRAFNLEVDSGKGTVLPRWREYNGKLLFAAGRTSQISLYDLWITDGTEAGTVELATVDGNQGAVRADLGVEYQNTLFFPVNRSLWRTNGTTEGTSQVLDESGGSITIGAGSFAEFDNYLYFVGNSKLYRLDSAQNETPELVSGIDEAVVAVNNSVDNKLLVAANNNLFTLSQEPIISMTNTTVDEDSTTQVVDVQILLDRAVDYETTARVVTQDGTAVAGSDFAALTTAQQTVTIAAGLTETSKTISLVNDTQAEDSENFSLVMSSPDGARFSNRSDESISATVTVTDSDIPVTAGSIQVNNAQVSEGGGSIDVSVITGGNSAVDIDFTFSVISGTATADTDFTATSGTGQIAANSTTTTINVPIIEDDQDEPNENFTVSVIPTAGLSTGLNQAVTGTVTIIDNDDTPVTPTATSSGGGAIELRSLAPMLGLLLLIVLSRRFSNFASRH